MEAMDVISILRKTEAGRKVEAFIKEKKGLIITHQITLIRLLFEFVTESRESPLKYYPETSVKMSMAKGIVQDFPMLADPGDCPWESWLRIVNTKFETVRSNLPKEKRKNNLSRSRTATSTLTATSSRSSSTVRGRASTSASCSSTSTPINDSSTPISSSADPEFVSKKSWLRDVVPSSRNKDEISQALEATFNQRRQWITLKKPTCTDIIQEYRPLASYEGEMIAEEFARMERLSIDLVSRFQIVASSIVNHASQRSSELSDAANRFDNDCLRALMVLPKLLAPTINSKTTSDNHVQHVKKFKCTINAIPSSALLQVAPAGTDVEHYQSVESSKDSPAPIFPFVLWCTNTQKDGKLYLKIDKLSFLVGCIKKPEHSGSEVLKAVSLSLKAHYVFNLEYHPSLKPFYNYLEVLAGINTNPFLCVTKMMTAIRNLTA